MRKNYNILIKLNFYIVKSIFIIFSILSIFYSLNKENLSKLMPNKFNNYKNEEENCLIFNDCKCLECNIGFKLIKSKCIYNYTFRAIYQTNFTNENVILINQLYEKFIVELNVDNEFKTPSFHFLFPKPGYHEIKFYLNTDLIYSSENMFFNISNLIFFEQNQGKMNKKLKSMKGMFKKCEHLKVVNFNHYIYNNIMDFSYMFDNCKSLKVLSLPFQFSNQVENVRFMFANCSSLKSIELSFNTENIKDMRGLFYGCSSLTSIDLSNFKTDNLINVRFMFAKCSSLKIINIESFNMNKIKDMNYMFYNCTNLYLAKLPNLNEKQIANINMVFRGCYQLSFSNIKIKSKKLLKLNDICIVGAWYGRNYGSMLTYYALHEVIKRMEYSILMVNDPLEPKYIIYNKIHPKSMVSYLYNVTQNHKGDNLSELNNKCKCFVTGSDQLWNIYLSRPLKQFYFLGFVDDKRKKISYATSFGIEYSGTEEEKNITKYNLQRFDGISVRDELSLNVAKDTFNIKDAVQVCDPAFLCDISAYLYLANKSNIINKPDEYILAYILDPSIEIGNRLEKLSIDKKIKVIIILDYPPENWRKNEKKLSLTRNGNLELKETVTINEWLWYFNNSKAIFTDSFHGTIFSIIFKKPFISLKNVRRGGERFPSLLKPLKLMYRLFETYDCINNNYELYDKIDYSIPLQHLSKIKKYSYNWLKNKLNTLLTHHKL